MTPEERAVFKDLLFWAEGFQRFAWSLRTKPPTTSLDDAVNRAYFLLEVNPDDAEG